MGSPAHLSVTTNEFFDLQVTHVRPASPHAPRAFVVVPPSHFLPLALIARSIYAQNQAGNGGALGHTHIHWLDSTFYVVPPVMACFVLPVAPVGARTSQQALLSLTLGDLVSALHIAEFIQPHRRPFLGSISVWLFNGI